MAAGLGDLIQVIDNQTYLGQNLLNAYYYRVTSLTGLAGDYLEVLADWFEEDIMTVIRSFQSNTLVHTTLSLRNLSNNLDFYEVNVNATGSENPGAGAEAPSFVTVGFQLIRETLATRNGYKRYSGLIEQRLSGNTYAFSSGVQANVENALAADIVLGLVTVAEPVIYRRSGPAPVGTSYTYASIGDAVYRGVGTQNTRKP